MVVARLAPGFQYIRIKRRRLQAGTRTVLANHAAVNFLPRRLVFQLRGLPGSTPLSKFLVRNQDIDPPRVEVQTDHVASFEQGQSTAYGSFGGHVENGGARRRTALSAITHRGQDLDASDRKSTSLNSSH